MKKITLKNSQTTVSATFQDDAGLDEVIYIVEGLIRSLGYCFNGNLDIVDEET